MLSNLRRFRDFTGNTLKPKKFPDYGSLPDPAKEGVIYETLDDNRYYMWDEDKGDFVQLSTPKMYNIVSYLLESKDVTSKVIIIDVTTGKITVDGSEIPTSSNIKNKGDFDYFDERTYYWNGERVEHTKITYNAPNIEMDLTDILLDYKIHKNDRLIIT